MINKSVLSQYVYDNCMIGLYDGEKFAIVPSWDIILECNRLQGSDSEYDNPDGDDVLSFDLILGLIDSEFPFPVDENLIDRISRSIETAELIDHGQLSFVKYEWSLDFSPEVARQILTYYQDNLSRFPGMNPVGLTNVDIKENCINPVEWGFNDEYHLCDNCGETVFRTSPDSYGWTPEFYETEDGEQICKECAQDYLDEAIEGIQARIDSGNQPRSLPWIFDLSDDWREIHHPKGYSWENGLHPGQNDSPLRQGQLIRRYKVENEPVFEVVFRIHPSQFDVSWETYIRVNPNVEYTLSDGELEEFINVFSAQFDSPDGRTPYDNAELAQKALQSASSRFNKISWDAETGEIDVRGTDDINKYLSE